MTDDMPAIDWEARLRAAVAETLARRAARRAEREQFQTRRAYGLEQRHARKLRDNARGSRGTQRGRGTAQIEPLDRLNLSQPEQEMEDVNRTPPRTPACCVSADGGVCPQHEQARRLNTQQGPRARASGGARVVGESGKAKPARDTEDNR